MAKYLKNLNGNLTEESTLTVSAGAGSATRIPELDGTGRLDVTFMPMSVISESVVTTAGEGLTAGDFVYYTGTGTAMKAVATAVGTQAQGFVLATTALSGTVTVYNLSGVNTSVTGLTPGAQYYLSGTTAGSVVVAASIPTGTGKISQRLGFAATATNLQVAILQPIVLA